MPLFSSKTPLKFEKIDLATTVSLKQWSSENLRQWLTDAGYDKKTVIDPIYKQQFDGSAIIIIKPEDLLDIGVPRGATLSLLSKVRDLVDQQIQIGLIQDSNMSTGLQLSKSPRGMVSPRTSQSISPRNVSPRNSNSGLVNDSSPLTTTSTGNSSTSTISNGTGSTNHLVLPPATPPHHHSGGGVSPRDSNSGKKPPMLPRKSEATLLLQAKVVQKHHDDDGDTENAPSSNTTNPSSTSNSSTNDEEKLEDDLTFDIEHGLQVSKTDSRENSHSCLGSSMNIIDPIHIADVQCGILMN